MTDRELLEKIWQRLSANHLRLIGIEDTLSHLGGESEKS